MKTMLLLLLLFLGQYVHAQSNSHTWYIGATHMAVQRAMLGEPGRELIKDSDENKDGWRYVEYTASDDSEIIVFAFHNDMCNRYLVSLNGIHKDDLNARYSDIRRLDDNNWMDPTFKFTVFVHREYNGGRTELTINHRDARKD